MEWQRTFDFSVSVERAWEAFNDHSRPTERIKHIREEIERNYTNPPEGKSGR